MQVDRLISAEEIAFFDESYAQRSAERSFPAGAVFYHGGRYPDEPLHNDRSLFVATTKDYASPFTGGLMLVTSPVSECYA